jgi:hypothetical protein
MTFAKRIPWYWLISATEEEVVMSLETSYSHLMNFLLNEIPLFFARDGFLERWNEALHGRSQGGALRSSVEFFASDHETAGIDFWRSKFIEVNLHLHPHYWPVAIPSKASTMRFHYANTSEAMFPQSKLIFRFWKAEIARRSAEQCRNHPGNETSGLFSNISPAQRTARITKLVGSESRLPWRLTRPLTVWTFLLKRPSFILTITGLQFCSRTQMLLLPSPQPMICFRHSPFSVQAIAALANNGARTIIEKMRWCWEKATERMGWYSKSVIERIGRPRGRKRKGSKQLHALNKAGTIRMKAI